MEHLSQSPTDPAFVQNPYPFYDRLRAAGPLVYWRDYAMPVAAGYAEVKALLKHRHLGREAPPGFQPPVPAHLADFYALEAHSMLELDPPRHTRLRGLVLRAFTSARVAAMEQDIARLCHALIDRFEPGAPLDLIEAYATPVPARTIARMLGVPDGMADQLVRWSNAMVAVYQAGVDRAGQAAANEAAQAFTAYLKDLIAHRRRRPGPDLLSDLISARDADGALSEEELIATAILLLNAGHEATVHGIGNGVKCLIEARSMDPAGNGEGPRDWLTLDRAAGTVEEVLRYDPPLHLFTRWVRAPVTLWGHAFEPGAQIGCLLAAASRDGRAFPHPHRFDPGRKAAANMAFGGGIHFCVGAPLARLELRIALQVLFARCPDLSIVAPPVYADLYHFHGLERLLIAV